MAMMMMQGVDRTEDFWSGKGSGKGVGGAQGRKTPRKIFRKTLNFAQSTPKASEISSTQYCVCKAEGRITTR